MALSFLSLPPELRVEIYRHLLCQSSWILWPPKTPPPSWSVINPAKGAQSGSEPGLLTRWLPESAILRTCRAIYSEAIPILYGENTFLYSCVSPPNFSIRTWPEGGFPDANIKHINHLKLTIDEWDFYRQWATVNVTSTLEYFIGHGCEVQTFELLLKGIQVYSEIEYMDKVERKIAINLDLEAALVKLKVSKSLTISFWHCGNQENHIDDLHEEIYDLFQDLVDDVASEKKMTIATQKLSDSGANFWLPEIDQDVNAYEMSWCLRPQHSEQQAERLDS